MSLTVTDPVCGMVIERPQAPAETTYQGTTYYFCSQRCKDAFDENPKKYIEKMKQSQDRK